jgi:large repetitive protein
VPGVPADPGDPDAVPPVPATPEIPAIPVTPIALTPSALAADQADEHDLRKVADQPIGGLQDGVTYYVDRIDADSFRLRSAPGGAVVALDATDALTGAVLTGTSTLGKESVDLNNVGSGSHRLVLDITADGSGTQILDGVGGARALAGAPSGDGVVTSAASGSGGGIVRVSGAEVSASTAPRVAVTIGSGAELAAQDITVAGLAKANISATSANSGGGLVSVGDAQATLYSAASSAVTVGSGATLTAGNDLTIRSFTDQNASVLAQSNGGGLVDFADADVAASLSYSATLSVLSGADLKADNRLELDARSELDVDARSNADSAGLGSSADTSAQVEIGTAADRALTRVQIAGRVQGAEVLVRARTTDLDVYTRAEGESGGAVADADASALVDIHDDVVVSLLAGAALTGDTVTLSATHSGVDLYARSNADTDGLYADADSTARVDYDSRNRVTSAAGSTTAARDLVVTATQSITRYDRSASADVDFLGSESTNESGDFDARREIDWNGNVTFLALPAPELLIDSNGLVVTADNVTVNGGMGAGGTVAGGTVSVDAIANNDTGTASFSVGNVADRDGKAAPLGEIKGAGGTFSSGSMFPTVSITNKSNKQLVIGDISLANGSAQPDVTLSAQTVTLGFEVGNLAPAGDTRVDIVNEGTGNVRINGLVDNPIGLIRIENTGGSIVAHDGSGDRLRGNGVELIAAGTIGDATRRLDVDLVRSAGRATDLAAAAGGDIRLDLTGRLRDTDAATAHSRARSSWPVATSTC